MSNFQKIVRPGDILIFKAGDNWVSKSIAWLTKSDVSHTAMMYSQDTIVEMGLSGIMVNKIAEEPDSDLAHIMRLAPEKDPQPLLNAASNYVNSKVAYDLPSLVLLGGLLVYRSIRPTPKLKIITDTILRMACAEIDKLIMRMRKDKRKTMVCSQLVYQCYLDCGKDYLIQIHGGDMQAFADNSPPNPQMIRLIDMMEAAGENDNVSHISPKAPAMRSEDAAKKLYSALLDSECTNDNAELDSAISFDDILPLVRKLLEKLEQLLEQSGTDLPIQALFVTPGDLLNHAVNLIEVGAFIVKRV